MAAEGVSSEPGTLPRELDVFFARRSIGRMTEPAPDDAELRSLLLAAAAAPDHGELRPRRFVVLRGSAKDAFGEVLGDAYLRRCEETGDTPLAGKLEKERTKLGRAPLVVIVCAIRRSDDKIAWEDQLGAAYAAAENLCLAATAIGFGSMWRTGEPCWDPRVKAAIGIGDKDEIVGFIYLGTPAEGSDRAPRIPDLDGLVEEWEPPAGGVSP